MEMAFGSDYPNLAILSWLTMLQKPLRELVGSYIVLFNTCLTKSDSNGRAERECEALRPTIEHSLGQKRYSM